MKEEYTFSIQSKIREEIILGSLVKDLDKEHLNLQALVTASISNIISPDQRKSLVDDIIEAMENSRLLGEYGNPQVVNKRKRKLKEFEGLVELFSMLDSSGALSKISYSDDTD